ncbi:AidB family quorum-quenching N-acyl homoserine lactonase [Bosea psychrotolerans]|uniref:Glyoxylase-like metal-dependent hydrolase (Beta-lactamase superfamily II) n=1 Tax=Bosea psychrotolerans TaxID=1871628 RepID=A0A2S4M855_9HYPH|nr:MBL fold metallo-hydrolase [Bosea psychrotolerans]POR50923.1 glyoxylase-like metal-dependent hydrolase (beta-lactamase superfamily II) [Bosea psychrotolerans]
MDQSSRRFGRYDITILHDGVFQAPADVLIHAGGDEARKQALAGWGKSAISVDVNCFLLRDDTGVTLVDAGTGASWGDAFGHARAALEATGVTPAQVQRVLISHLHGDHALGLFDGEAPYFPQAEIWVPQVELAFFTDEQARESLPASRRSGFVIAAKLQSLYGGRIRSFGEGEILPGIAARTLPGHTPGHTGFIVQDAQHSLLLWGDLVHVEDLQPEDPDVGLVYDLDPAAAVRSRHIILKEAARDGWVVSGGHITGFQRLEAVGDSYRLVPA